MRSRVPARDRPAPRAHAAAPRGGTGAQPAGEAAAAIDGSPRLVAQGDRLQQVFGPAGTADGAPAQRKVEAGRLNVIGERHSDYPAGRGAEQAYLQTQYGIAASQYWTESEFRGVEKTAESRPKQADPIIGHIRVQLLGLLAAVKEDIATAESLSSGISPNVVDGVVRYWQSAFGGFLDFFGPHLKKEGYDFQDQNLAVDDVDKERLRKAWPTFAEADEAVRELKALKEAEAGKWFGFTTRWNQEAQRTAAGRLLTLLHRVDQAAGNVVYALDDLATVEKGVNVDRERSMAAAADRAVDAGITGAWKVGQSHVDSLLDAKGPHGGSGAAKFTLTGRDEFQAELKKGP